MTTEGQRQQAADQQTDPKILERLAETCPELRGLIYQNPSCPTRTKEWLHKLGKDELDQTMASTLAALESSSLAGPRPKKPSAQQGTQTPSALESTKALMASPSRNHRKQSMPLVGAVLGGVVVVGILAIVVHMMTGSANDAATIDTIVNDSDCSSAVGDAAALSASVSRGKPSMGAFSAGLNTLSGTCGAEYTIALQTALSQQQLTSDFAGVAASQDWYELAKPAPSGALEVYSFTSKRNKIRCQIYEDNVSCTSYIFDYPSVTPECEGTPETYTIYHAGDVEIECLSWMEASTIVEYDSSVAANGFACTIEPHAGFTCWSELSGHGFNLTQAAYATF